jgi:hypothetical protein
LAAAVIWVLVGICAGAVLSYAASVFVSRLRARRPIAQPAAAPATAPVVKGAVNVLRPNSHTVEGLEIQYGTEGLVRSVRVGAMNSEHKELLLTMDPAAWGTMPNAQKQEVLAAARSTWAQKMCGSGPDIAYVVVKTEMGDIVGRADPHSVTIL